MQRMAQRCERRLVEGFAQRRMSVDGERNVFETRAHFKRQRKGGRELAVAGAEPNPCFTPRYRCGKAAFRLGD